MPKLHYLTVQDILWINLQVTKKVHHFSHARLEEATYYQYAYGDSQEPIGQAARFLAGFLRMRPLDAGVEATAFVSTVAFLRINGLHLRLDDAQGASWFCESSGSTQEAREALEKVVEEDAHAHHGLRPDVRAAVRAVMECYPATVADLSAATTATR